MKGYIYGGYVSHINLTGYTTIDSPSSYAISQRYGKGSSITLGENVRITGQKYRNLWRKMFRMVAIKCNNGNR